MGMDIIFDSETMTIEDLIHQELKDTVIPKLAAILYLYVSTNHAKSEVCISAYMNEKATKPFYFRMSIFDIDIIRFKMMNGDLVMEADTKFYKNNIFIIYKNFVAGLYDEIKEYLYGDIMDATESKSLRKVYSQGIPIVGFHFYDVFGFYPKTLDNIKGVTSINPPVALVFKPNMKLDLYIADETTGPVDLTKDFKLPSRTIDFVCLTVKAIPFLYSDYYTTHTLFKGIGYAHDGIKYKPAYSSYTYMRC